MQNIFARARATIGNLVYKDRRGAIRKLWNVALQTVTGGRKRKGDRL